MKTDCAYFESNKCTILKKLYCKKEECSFYKQDKTKKNYIIKEENHKRNKMTDEERKAKKREYGKYYYQKHKTLKEKEIEYKNYGELYFSDDEVQKLKKGVLKIY